jgi:hypothetical protein
VDDFFFVFDMNSCNDLMNVSFSFFCLLFYTNLILLWRKNINTIIVFQKSSTAFFLFSLIVCLFVLFIENAVSFVSFLYTSTHMHQDDTIRQMDENDIQLSVNKMMNVYMIN